MKISYSSDELISEVEEDISLYGKNMSVYAIYSYFGEDVEFITDYVHADKPTRDEVVDEIDYQKIIRDWNKSLDTLKDTKHEKMTLVELLKRLNEQNKIF